MKTHIDERNNALLSSLEETLDNAERRDTVLIFYAGHGKLDRKGRLCLAAANTSAQLRATSVTASHLADLVNASRCECVIVLLDCCYSGAFGTEAAVRGDAESQLSLMSKARGLHIFTASTSTQTSSELVTHANGVIMGRFTHAIVEGIRTGSADLDNDQKISLTDLRLYVERVVTEQNPRYWVRDVSGDPIISLATKVAAGISNPTSLLPTSAFEPLDTNSPTKMGSVGRKPSAATSPFFTALAIVFVILIASSIFTFGVAVVWTQLDSDNDGVNYPLDMCSSPPGQPVNEQGCPIETSPSQDQANGGNKASCSEEGQDSCADAKLPTAAPSVPTPTNCSDLDADGDGVNNCDDKCTSFAGEPIGPDGCKAQVSIDLKGVNFDKGSAALRPDAIAILNEAIQIMERYRDLRVEVAGHTQWSGVDEDNQHLSELRAKMVYDYMIARGISADRLTHVGYGEIGVFSAFEFENDRVELNVQ